jgi:hypothetical protein
MKQRQKKGGKLVSLDILTTTKTYPIKNKKITYETDDDEK